MNLLEWGFLLVFPITQEHFINLKERVAFCSVFRDGKLADYTEGKVFIKATSIYVSSMYRNLQGLEFSYSKMSDFKEKLTENKVEIEFKYGKRLVVLESYRFVN
jgi:hypothetical protein